MLKANLTARLILPAIAIFFCCATGYGAVFIQQPDTAGLQFLNWYNASPDSNGIHGASVNRAYRELLSGKNPQPVIVAVIDGGVDIRHEDLEGHVWINEGEIENNGIDDDLNGYIDDRHGWNFLGNSKGENITYENMEVTRLVRKFSGRDSSTLEKSEEDDYAMYPRARSEFERMVKKYESEKEKIDQVYKGYVIASGNIKSYLGQETYSYGDLRMINTEDDVIRKSRNYLLYLHNINYTLEDLEDIKENNYNHLYYHLNLTYDPRNVVGDDPEKQDNLPYGNNDVTGNRPEHGTFVIGIIAGLRNNGKGIDGIAPEVRIMSLLAVPDGDERDKDVANAIIYAVNNGASIINCSFGKNFSPQKEFVDEALRLAQSKGVLVIHAAGNEGTNIDMETHYPTNHLNGGVVLEENWISVGASSMYAGKTLPGKFSNYGTASVDLFAPGVDIYSLYPENKYKTGNGTSYASPVVAGVAAMIKSYYPQLTAHEIKNIILESATRLPKLKVYVPTQADRQKKKLKFAKLSKTGGLVNAYEAVKLAEKTMKSKDPTTP